MERVAVRRAVSRMAVSTWHAHQVGLSAPEICGRRLSGNKRRRTLAIVALFGLCAPASSQELCPELARLHAEAEAQLQKAAGLVAQDRCYAYVHYSEAWGEIKNYAYVHREACNISASLLSELSRRHRQAVEEREDACGGRPRNWELPKTERKMFPPEFR